MHGAVFMYGERKVWDAGYRALGYPPDLASSAGQIQKVLELLLVENPTPPPTW